MLFYEWSKTFSKRKEKSSLPSLGYFWLNGEEKFREWSSNNIIEKSCQIEDN